MPVQEHLIADALTRKTFGKAKASFVCCLCFLLSSLSQTNNLLEIAVQRHSLCIARFTASQAGSSVLQQHGAEYQSTISSPTQIRYF